MNNHSIHLPLQLSPAWPPIITACHQKTNRLFFNFLRTFHLSQQNRAYTHSPSHLNHSQKDTAQFLSHLSPRCVNLYTAQLTYRSATPNSSTSPLSFFFVNHTNLSMTKSPLTNHHIPPSLIKHSLATPPSNIDCNLLNKAIGPSSSKISRQKSHIAIPKHPHLCAQATYRMRKDSRKPLRKHLVVATVRHRCYYSTQSPHPHALTLFPCAPPCSSRLTEKTMTLPLGNLLSKKRATPHSNTCLSQLSSTFWTELTDSSPAPSQGTLQ